MTAVAGLAGGMSVPQKPGSENRNEAGGAGCAGYGQRPYALPMSACRGLGVHLFVGKKRIRRRGRALRRCYSRRAPSTESGGIDNAVGIVLSVEKLWQFGVELAARAAW